MASEDEADALRRLLARHSRPQLAEDFAGRLMRRLRQDERTRERQPGRWAHVVMIAYWLAALSASAGILRQGSLPAWASATLWLVALLLVPVGYSIALWSSMGALANRERG